MTDFFQTRMGRVFYESTMPNLVNALVRIDETLGRIADSLDELAKLEKEKKTCSHS